MKARPHPAPPLTAAATLLGLLTAAACGGGDAEPVPVTTTPTSPRFELSMATVTFGRWSVGESDQQTVVLTNTGDAPGTVSFSGQNVRLMGDDDPFVISGVRAGDTIPAGESVTLAITFTPPSDGPLAGQARFVCREDCPPATLALEGTGVAEPFGCQPSALDFAQVPPTSCRSRAVTCQNLASPSVTVSGWQFEGADDYDVEPSRAVVLDVDDELSIDVTLCPADVGPRAGTLEVNSEGAIVSVAVSGVGGGPDLRRDPGSIDFGPVAVDARARRALILRNVGVDPLEVAAIAVEPDVFSLPPGIDRTPTVDPGAAIEVVVQLDPRAAQTYEGQLTIVSNDADQGVLMVPLRGEGVSLPSCQYRVEPPSLDFGFVEGGTRLRRSVIVHNEGDDDCLLSSARIEDAAASPFALASRRDGVTIPAQGAIRIPVVYDNARPRSDAGRLELSISNPARPLAEVRLSGSPSDASLLVAPSQLDFGPQALSCGLRGQVRLHNFGDVPVTIEAIRTSSPLSVRAPALPRSLGPRTTMALTVTATTGPTPAHLAGVVEIVATYRGASRTFFAGVDASGSASPEARQEWTQPTRNDLLVVVDRAEGPVAAARADIAAALSAVLDGASAGDYRVGVIGTEATEDIGRLCAPQDPTQDAVITPASLPDPASALARVMVCSAPGGGPRSALEAARRALFQPRRFNENAGFLRTDATLSLLFITAAVDSSPVHPGPPEAGSGATVPYLDAWRAVKGVDRPGSVLVTAVVPDASACAGGPTAARVPQLARATGGDVAPVCTDDWVATLDGLADPIRGQRTSWVLQATPAPGTLTVRVDGVALPAGAYALADRTVTLSAPPEPGAELTLTYQPLCENPAP